MRPNRMTLGLSFASYRCRREFCCNAEGKQLKRFAAAAPLPPSLFPAGRTVLLFPGDGASTVKQLVHDRAMMQRNAGSSNTGSSGIGGGGGGGRKENDGDGRGEGRDGSGGDNVDADDDRLVVVVLDVRCASPS